MAALLNVHTSETRLNGPVLAIGKYWTTVAPARRGAVLTLTAMFLLALVDSSTRQLTSAYSPWQIVWIRLLCFLLLMAITQGQMAFVGFRPRRPVLQLIRSFVLLAEIVAFILAFKHFPLADVHAIAAICPLLTVLLATIFLGESVPRIVWFALVLGMAGMCLILTPNMSGFRIELLFPICGAILWSVYQVLTKLASRDDSARMNALFTPAVGVVVLAFAMPFAWTTPTLKDALVLVASGCIGAAAHFLIVKAVSICDTALLQPFNFSIFFWAILFGICLFDEWPSSFVVLGACILFATSALCMRLGSTSSGRSDGDTNDRH